MPLPRGPLVYEYQQNIVSQQWHLKDRVQEFLQNYQHFEVTNFAL